MNESVVSESEVLAEARRSGWEEVEENREIKGGCALKCVSSRAFESREETHLNRSGEHCSPRAGGGVREVRRDV